MAKQPQGRNGSRRVGAYLDLENLLHRHRGDPNSLRDACDRLVQRIDQLGTVVSLVGACNYWLARVLIAAKSAPRIRFAICPVGRDSADRALLRALETVPGSVDTLVIGSGDAVFLGAVRRARASGLEVVLLSMPGSTSIRLRAAADRILAA